MADVSGRQWADVFVEDEDCRHFLEGKALFYIPAANSVAQLNNQNIALLTARSTTAKADGNPNLPGRQVIAKVIKCEEPVSYESALNFLTLINLTVTNGPKLTTADMVACVFRLRDAHLLKALPLDAESIARGCGLRPVLVKEAIDEKDRTRITYHDAERIWSFLCDYIKKNKPKAADDASWPPEILHLLNGDPLNFIIADMSKRYPVEVAKIGRISPDDPEQTYIYSRSLLIKAPRDRHPWAIGPETDPRPASTGPRGQ